MFHSFHHPFFYSNLTIEDILFIQHVGQIKNLTDEDILDNLRMVSLCKS